MSVVQARKLAWGALTHTQYVHCRRVIITDSPKLGTNIIVDKKKHGEGYTRIKIQFIKGPVYLSSSCTGNKTLKDLFY